MFSVVLSMPASGRIAQRFFAIPRTWLDNADTRLQRLHLLAEVVRVLTGIGHDLLDVVPRLVERDALGVDRRIHRLVGTPGAGAARAGVVSR